MVVLVKCIMAFCDQFSNNEILYKIQTTFKFSFAYYLLYQSTQEALNILSALLDWAFTIKPNELNAKHENIQFIEEILKNAVSFTDRNDMFIPNFWIIWNELLKKMKDNKRCFFHSNLLLYSQYWKDEATD